jgi:hypothetical protein
MKRFKVVTTEGFTIGGGGSRSGSAAPGLTASVLDTAYAHREVKRYRSEDYPGGSGKRLGVDGALRAAKAYATWLNRQPDLA